MRYSSNIFLITILFTILSFNVRATEDIVLMNNYIKQKLFCENTSLELEQTLIRTHYFELTRTRIADYEPKSVVDIMKSGMEMATEFKAAFELSLKSFMEKYLNIGDYTNNFYSQKFHRYNNLVMGSLRTTSLSVDRFEDWVDLEYRTDPIVTNIFTSTISSHRLLIEEFSEINQKYAQIKKMIPQMQGQLEINGEELFLNMKTETIDYLALIFLSAFEHESEGVFSSTDNILELYWENFYDWLEIDGCEKLVNGAYNGALSGIKNQAQLRQFLNSSQNPDHSNPIQLTGDLNQIAMMNDDVSDIGLKMKDFQNWQFFDIENLEETNELLNNIEVSNKVKYDIFRLEDPDHCLSVISVFQNFLDMKNIYKNKVRYTSPLEYYYLVEYFLRLINQPDTLDEFPDEDTRNKAIRVIYLFINQIILTKGKELNNLDSFGKRMSYIIIHILTEMGQEGQLRYILDGDVLDEETQLYIYKLFIFLTEKVNLPKPDESEELNKAKKTGVTDPDDEEPHVKINPKNPRFRKVIDRLYVFASKPSDKVAPWVKRFRNKYYDEMLIEKNPMFLYDEKFFILEKKMAKEFENTFDFQNAKKEYENLKIEYLTLVKGLSSKGETKPTNEAIILLTKYYFNKIVTTVKEMKAQGSVTRDQVQAMVDDTLLSYFGKLKSNMIEKEYFKTIILCVEKLKPYKINQPDFKTLLQGQVDVNDRVSLFEYMKRIVTYVKHNKRSSDQKLVDTLDINEHHYQDLSTIRNGERFRTLMMDVTEFFEPELRRLQRQNLNLDGGQISFGDLEDTIQQIVSQTLPEGNPENKSNLENFRLMMQWNLFDDISEYLPLTREFLSDTKANDTNGHPLRMRMLIENYTNLYFIMIEHRLFCAEHKFSFEGTGEDRLTNLLAYLHWRNSQYQQLLANPLPDKEVKFSALNVREIQNLIYFLTFRLKKLALSDQFQNMKMTEQYFPYSFREIYMLSSTHPELISVIDYECEQMFAALESEKQLRKRDISKVSISQELKQSQSFQFCMLYKFNLDMVSLVEARGQANKELDGHQMTITREDIFNELIAPYYDKLSPLHMLIQVFNLNMNHSSAVANQSAATFSSYITLLDYFFQIIDDLKDGQNDTLKLTNLNGSQVTEILVQFCQSVDNKASPELIQEQLVFIRTVLLERLKPVYHVNGPNLRMVFKSFTNGNNVDNVNEFISKLVYGRLMDGQMGLSSEGDILDYRLLSLLMVYSPHTEFTVQVIHKMNLMSNLPKLIMNAKDNEGIIYKEFPEEDNKDAVFDNCFKWMMVKIGKVNDAVDIEAQNSLETGDEFDLDLEGLEDEFYTDELNSEFAEEEIIVPVNTRDSNIVSDQKTQQVLINVIEKVSEVIIDDDEEDTGPIINNKYVIQSQEMSEDDNLLLQASQSLTSQDNEQYLGLKIRNSREESSILDLEGKNISQSIDSQNQKHIVLSSHQESVDKQITQEVAKNSAVHNAVFTLNFRTTAKDAPELDAKHQEMIQKLTMQTLNKIMSKKQLDTQTSVKVNKVTKVSQRFSMDTSSKFKESSEILNEASKEIHFKGKNNNEIAFSVDGKDARQYMRSSQDNKIYGNALFVKMKDNFENLIDAKLGQIQKPRSKSYSGNQGKVSSETFGKISKGKTFNSTKFIRLV